VTEVQSSLSRSRRDAEIVEERTLADGDSCGADTRRMQCRGVRRVHIKKSSGGQRPLGILTLEDKLVQRATTTVMNAICEVDFLGFSYGFRPGCSQHTALDALAGGLREKGVR